MTTNGGHRRNVAPVAACSRPPSPSSFAQLSSQSQGHFRDSPPPHAHKCKQAIFDHSSCERWNCLPPTPRRPLPVARHQPHTASHPPPTTYHYLPHTPRRLLPAADHPLPITRHLTTHCLPLTPAVASFSCTPSWPQTRPGRNHVYSTVRHHFFSKCKTLA